MLACQCPNGGFGGGNQQLAHCAPTYAACLALVILGDTRDSDVREQAYAAVHRHLLYAWFYSLKDPATGAFRMHHDGEVDVRGTYTVVAIAALFNILTPELSEGVAEYCLACQTQEGGFAGEPGAEAHGGYVFCAIAALAILERTKDVDVEALEYWLAMRQTSVEGGFQGRCNKLVDGCYSFWQGGTAALVTYMKDPRLWSALRWNCHQSEPSESLPWTSEEETPELATQPPNPNTMCFNSAALQRYILLCAQQVEGGLRDKPGKMRDYYHTCYNLSGLSVAQHPPQVGAGSLPLRPYVWGSASNRVPCVHPAFNVRQSAAEAAMAYFSSKPCSHASLMQQAGIE